MISIDLGGQLELGGGCGDLLGDVLGLEDDDGAQRGKCLEEHCLKRASKDVERCFNTDSI